MVRVRARARARERTRAKAWKGLWLTANVMFVTDDVIYNDVMTGLCNDVMIGL